MKYFLIVITIFLSGCTACIKKAEPLRNKDKIMIEPLACYQYRECIYYSSVSKKNNIDCSYIYAACRKDDIYEYCKRAKNRPKGVGFQTCWNMKD